MNRFPFDPAADASVFEGVVYRSASPAYAAEVDFLSGEGSRLTGGRWNRPGVAAVYASLTPEAAMAETLAHVRYLGLPDHRAMPRVFQAIEVRLPLILDLTNEELIGRRGMSKKDCTGVDWRADAAAGREPLTWQIGTACRDGGFQGLLVPSAAAAGGRSLIWFPDRLDPECSTRLVGAASSSRD